MLPDVAGRVLGGAVLWTNDDFYADVHMLIAPTRPRHDPLRFDARGKVYDGWETRRRRPSGAALVPVAAASNATAIDGPAADPGHDAVIIRLATPAVIRGVDIDTAHFRGNFPPYASVEATTRLGYPSVADLLCADWTTLVERTALEGDSANVLPAVGPDRLVTHLRLSIYPDGGVARFRAYGEVHPDPRFLGGRIDAAATLHGGRILACSNMFYASPANVLAPGRATVMSDGWETARRRDDGNDWLIVRLAAPTRLHHAIIDTSRFVGNAPGWASLTDVDTGAVLLDRVALSADTEHRLRLAHAPAVTQLRLDIYPDGGISRLRLMGELVAEARDEMGRRWLSLLPADQAALIDRTEFFD